MSSKDEYLPSISIVVLTLNSSRMIADCVKSLADLDYPEEKREILVVDGGSTDNTLKILENYPVKIITHGEKGFGKARNIGIRHSKNEIILFTDSDCVVDKNWAKELAKYFQEGLLVVGGPCLPTKTNTFGYCVAALGYPGGGLKRVLEEAGETKELSTCNLAIGKDVFKEIGYFDETFVHGSEDADFIRRVGEKHSMRFNPKAVVYHKPRENMIDFLKWSIRRGKADVEYHKKYVPAFPRSLLSLKVSKLEQLILLILILIFSIELNLILFYAVIFLFLIQKLRDVYKKQGYFKSLSKYLPISSYHFWITIPFLGWLFWFTRDIGRIIGYAEYLLKSKKSFTKGIM